MKRVISAAVAAAVMVTAFTLGGCGADGVITQTCIDWVYFETPSDAAADADAVIVGDVVGQAGTTTYEGMPATTWHVRVETWLDHHGEDIDGGPAGSDEIVVTSLPRSCQEPGDSIAEHQDVDSLLFFLRDTEAGWETVTPYQGVTPAGPGNTIPAEWPEPPED